MPHPTLRLFDVPAGPSTFRFDLEPEGLTPRALDVLRAEIAALPRKSGWIELEGHEPTTHPELRDILAVVGELGLRVRLTTLGDRLDARGVLESMRDAGLAHLVVTLWGGSEATHDAVIGRTGALGRALEVVDAAGKLNQLRVTVRFVLLAGNTAEVGPLVARVRDHSNRFELVRLSTLTQDPAALRAHGVARDTATRAVLDAWEAARVTHLRLATAGFSTWPRVPGPSDAAPQPVDASLLDLLRDSVPVPTVANGTWATPRDGDVSGVYAAVEESRSLAELGLQLAAYGCPPLDLPPAMGGLGLDSLPGDVDPDRPAMRRRDGVPALLASTFPDRDVRDLPAWSGVGAQARVAVVAGWLTDNVLALSTLPALAASLRAQGADAVLHSAWAAPFNPYDGFPALPDGALAARPDGSWAYPDALSESLSNPPARVSHVRKQVTPWLASLDLSDRDVVVVPGWENALGVLDNPTLRPDARVILPDFHLMTGIADWHARWPAPSGKTMGGGWWPSERIEVHALYPRQVRAYWRAGVPLRQIHWRPYPVSLGHFGQGPDPRTCTRIFAGGSHQRDWKTLAEAARLLGPRVDRLVVHSRETLPAPLVNGGEVRLLAFHAALANARFVVLPLDIDPRKPAGISVISMALAAGRPMIATATTATIDHLRDGVNALLVPPSRPEALAAAIARLDDDEALLGTLAEGARASGRVASVDAWARDLIHGAPRQATFGGADGRGPFNPWPSA